MVVMMASGASKLRSSFLLPTEKGARPCGILARSSHVTSPGLFGLQNITIRPA